VQIRPGTPDHDPNDDEFSDDGEATHIEPATSAQWRVDRTMLAAKVIGIVAFAAIPQAFQFNLVSRWFGALVAVALALYAIRDLVAPVRLSADQDGVRVVVGFAGHRDIPWSEVDGLRIDPRRRSGFLEVETSDTLHLFSRYDLSMLPADALEMLEQIRP
jgi:PH (Pleckstrin Homology) domain-containing protein